MTTTATYENFRARVLKSLTDELIGPGPTDDEKRQHEVLEVSPLQLYATGVLFPQKSLAEQREDEGISETSGALGEDSSEEAQPELETYQDSNQTSENAGLEEQPLNLANEFNPSAMGITVRVKPNVPLQVRVDAARYNPSKVEVPHPKAGHQRADGTVYPASHTTTHYVRVPLQDTFTIPLGDRDEQHVPIPIAGQKGELHLHVRTRAEIGGLMTVSLALVNHKKLQDGTAPTSDMAFFQPAIAVCVIDDDAGFLPIDRAGGVADDQELASLDLLYRFKRSFALGHGCSAEWTVNPQDSSRASEVRTAFIPRCEQKPVRPREKSFTGIPLDLTMRRFSESGVAKESVDDVFYGLNQLADDYEAWINARGEAAEALDKRHQDPARRHLANCRSCLARMREGIHCLAENADVMLAFRLSNRAMLIQQIRTSLPVREPGDPFEELPGNYEVEPGSDPAWRPFQLAFILMNIACCHDGTHLDRKTCDLIWFPTGGGKTEAYLGLAAFSICLRRLRHQADYGTEVLMRYTLRLLTAQQFQRAAALITALDSLRRDKCYGAELGDSPISIGLWVGVGLTPNHRRTGLEKLNELRGSNPAENPFQLLRCPWCRTSLDRRTNLGYDNEPFTPNGAESVIFRCPNEGCRWHSPDCRLPVVVIDDDLYETPPTLLLGTVDKFAQLAWEPRTGRFFGVDTGWQPPGLIIQDELHLISGPLGTMVGLYETIIEALCTVNDTPPKIVASTATIRESGKQCWGLYARERFEFPPQGLDAGDSYFAYEDLDAPGRLYAGVFGTAVKSHATAQVRVVSPLLQSVMPVSNEKVYDESIADGYATILWYFNSLRELGHAVTMCTGDIREHHFNLTKRHGIEPGKRRRLHKEEELTSRRTADEIPRILDELNRSWSPEPSDKWPIDILLATNMISVGVDVSRLGLMVVTGQPKSTSEYVQATSRVGRSFPGLIVTVYNPARSRDRSHYEQFVSYHQAIYRYVEPTSVTPFSAPARSRGFAGLLIAMARLIGGIEKPAQITEYGCELEQICSILHERVLNVDARESDDAEREIETILRRWEDATPPEFGRMAGRPKTRTLMYPYGRDPDEELESDAFPVLTSMRNVDATCSAKVLTTYPKPQD